ncbi:MAG: radical SAM protein [bacterium]|nr:radical SAM protein [bacterium]
MNVMSYPKAVVSDNQGNIFDVDGIRAAGMKAGHFYPLHKEELIPLPYGSEIFTLPERIPIGFEKTTGKLVFFEDNPFQKSQEACHAVAAFVSPGYTTTYNAAYFQEENAPLLPLFSYAALCWYKGRFYTSAVRVDRERRQDLRLMDTNKLTENIKKITRLYPNNRLVKHLTQCASKYGCPAAKNFFLERYEAPLPSSPKCNARCVGCISLGNLPDFPATQPRIKFVPTPDELAGVAIHHIKHVKKPVVSFGQGCEGEPLLAGDVLVKAVQIIRAATQKGTINLNTNASKPDLIRRLCQAGLDSIRVSINSVREHFYNLYYRPIDYNFAEVVESIRIMKEAGKFVSINYLVMPGFTDAPDEFEAMIRFVKETGLDMIQWRNLNYDPLMYFKMVDINDLPKERLLGVKEEISYLKEYFPELRHGYFNPFFR